MSGCTDCRHNRVPDSENDPHICVCPSESINHEDIGFYYCTTCTVSVIKVILQPDYTKINFEFFVDIDIPSL